ncbi:hypothetical protein KA405_03515 [Patescibacteria group bacterium]|nr:hypothetical protein [Patescibacteria group bacterium]
MTLFFTKDFTNESILGHRLPNLVASTVIHPAKEVHHVNGEAPINAAAITREPISSTAATTIHCADTAFASLKSNIPHAPMMSL